MPLLFDTGPLYALADSDDAWHKRVRDWLEARREPIVVPVTVLPEVAYLLRSRLGGEVERRFVESLAEAELSVEPLRLEDLARSAELLETYPDIGFVDSTVVAMAERLRLGSVVTTDHRHFSTIRPRHCLAFDLLPP